MAKIFLSSGEAVLVDDSDVARLAGKAWHLHKDGYA